MFFSCFKIIIVFSSWTHMFFSCFKCGGGQDSESLSSAGSDSDDEDDEDGGDESG